MLSLKGIMGAFGLRPQQFAILLMAMVSIAIPAFGVQAGPTYQQAVDALYNLDFSIAEHAFDSLIAQDQANPDYWNGRASTIWWRILYNQQKFNIDSYSGSSLGGRGARDVVDPAEETKLRNTIEVAIAKAKDMLTKNPNDVRALYAMGVSNATLAAFEGIGKRSYPAAISKARTARNYHAQVLKLDPSFNDAQFTIGTYDYGVSVIPWYLRPFALLVGVSGSGKEEGIRKLEIAATKGSRAMTDAKMILIVIYNRERRYEQSMHYLDELLAKYPRNFQFEMEKASVCGKMKNWNEAADVYQHILVKIQNKQDGYDRLRPELVYAQLGNANVNGAKSAEAIEAYGKVVGSSKASDDEKADAYLWIGKIYDSGNDRSKAIEQYNAVLNLNCSKQYKDDASGFLRKPFK